MWDKTPLEEAMEETLKKQFPGNNTSDEYIRRYNDAKKYLIENVYDEIHGKEPQLTKHGASHIENVLRNAGNLLHKEMMRLTGLDLYFLCLIILFHDAGMIKGRTGHNDRKKIAEVYNAVRKGEAKYNQERSLLIKSCEAHCGTAKDDSKDTLKYIEKTENLDGYPIRQRDLSAILRFSDELAEGFQRTSDYMNQIHGYDEKSQIYHDYANITNVFIDKGGERIALTYHVDLKDFNSLEKFREILTFVYKRIIKLDEERGYNKYYTNLLLPFKKTSVRLNFCENGVPFDFELPIIELIDNFPIPDQKKDGDVIIQSNFPEYEIDSIFKEITQDVTE
jgi:hypothetical protein